MCSLEVCSHRLNRVRNSTYFTKSKRTPCPLNRTASNSPKGLDLSRELPGEGGGRDCSKQNYWTMHNRHFISLLPLSHASHLFRTSRKMLHSLQLAHEAPVMQATAFAVVERKPEKIHACMRFKLLTSVIRVQHSTNWATCNKPTGSRLLNWFVVNFFTP